MVSADSRPWSSSPAVNGTFCARVPQLSTVTLSTPASPRLGQVERALVAARVDLLHVGGRAEQLRRVRRVDLAGRRPTFAPSGSRDTSDVGPGAALVTPGICTYRSWSTSRS
jgi:hypothetical protein